MAIDTSKLGNYIFNSLNFFSKFRLSRIGLRQGGALLYGFLILSSIVAGGAELFGPRYGGLGGMINRPPITIIGTSGLSSGKSMGRTAEIPSSGIPASLKMLTSGSPFVGSPSGLENARLSQTKFAVLCACAPRVTIPTSIPAFWRAIAIILANHAGSESASEATMTAGIFPLSFCKISNDSWVNVRADNCFSNSTRAKSVFAARSIASESFAFDLARNSVWSLLFNMPNSTSPTMPMATPASGTAESFKNRPYGGSIMAMANSAMIPTMTRKPHQILQRSHEPDAPSNSFSWAYFVPFGRYHAGKNGFRTCCIAFVVWSLILAFLLGAIYWSNT